MEKILTIAITIATFTSPAIAQTPEQLKSESIKTSYLLAIGKKASSGEVSYWMGQNLATNQMLKTLVENHRQYLQNNPDLKRDMIRRSFKNAYGRNPTDQEVSTNMSQNYIYADWITNHVAWLRKSSTDYENVIRIAFQTVMGRQPQQGEISYWKSKGAMAYYLLASCIDNCRRSSGTSTCANNTMGASSSYADILSVSPQIASQASGIIGQAAANVVAPGGGNVVSAGGANVVAAGGLN